MTVVFGFGGVHADENGITINPRLFSKWKSLQFNLAYRGDGFQITVTKTSVTIVSQPANSREHLILVGGNRAKCVPGKSVTMQYRSFKVGRK
jgi:trehalose/maltose hydrolase-like predicted phosphorylase